MFASHVFSIGLVLLASAAPPAISLRVRGAERADYPVLSRFFKAVDSYVVQHHRLFEPIPDEIMCLPPDALEEAGRLAAVPRDMRPAPREGGIFGPEVAAWFRQRLESTLVRHRYDRSALLDDMDEGVLVAPPVVVNEPLDWMILEGTLGGLTRELPLLPEELGYRFVGRDLVLVDLETNIVVDVVRGALPAY